MASEPITSAAVAPASAIDLIIGDPPQGKPRRKRRPNGRRFPKNHKLRDRAGAKSILLRVRGRGTTKWWRGLLQRGAVAAPPSPLRGPLPPLTGGEKLQPRFLAHHRHAQRLGGLELRARAWPGDYDIGSI